MPLDRCKCGEPSTVLSPPPMLRGLVRSRPWCAACYVDAWNRLLLLHTVLGWILILAVLAGMGWVLFRVGRR